MVDEFQDTNPLQNELLELLEADNLFRVGDERQSIYGFRHADVRVFRRHLEAARAAGRAERMTVNFRSRGEVLDAVDMVFEGLWGDGFDALAERPGARDQPPRADPCVELLVCDREPKRWQERFPPEDEPAPFGTLGATDVTIWREAEARLLAKRIDELCGPGPAVRLRRLRAAAPRHHPHGRLRAGADRPRHRHPRAGRARLLGPATGGRPAPLPGRAGQPAGRAGAALGAGLPAGRAVAGHPGGAGRAGQALGPGGHLAGHVRGRRAARACSRARSSSCSRRSWTASARTGPRRRGSRWRR